MLLTAAALLPPSTAPREMTLVGTRLPPIESPQYMVLSFSSPPTDALWMPFQCQRPSLVTLPLQRPSFDQTKYRVLLSSHLRLLLHLLRPKAHDTLTCTNCPYSMALWLLVCISEPCRCALTEHNSQRSPNASS